jgi:sigma-B regulation protein RsbU (phosphoserine phosphatase)
MPENKILVVDDIKKNIQVLGSTLVKQGYAVSYATEGAKALKMVSKENFDLILLDIMMPGMDGFQVCRRLKQDQKTKDIPILFLTAKSEQDDIVKGLEQGAVDYLTKPFNTVELIARIKNHIALCNARAELALRNSELEKKNQKLEMLLKQNQKAMEEIKILQGILPICSACKKIRDDKGYWNRIESYIESHSEAFFSHGMCPDCTQKYYGKEDWYIKLQKK